jgi:hypothetical protein
MEKSGRKMGYGLMAGALLIAAAIAILVAWIVGKWWYFLPVLMIEGGILGIASGFLTGRQGTTSARAYAVYSSAWGVILALFGVLLLVNDLAPNNLPLLVVVFLIAIGAMAIAIAVGRRK